MEESEESELDKATKAKVEKGIQKLLEEKELKAKWQKELLENTAFMDYLSDYNENSQNDTISNYINKKYYWYIHSEFYRNSYDKQQTKWLDLAQKCLIIILQKKLFDLQCLWRAEQIEIEQIELGIDFSIIGKNILDCTFLEPITANEIRMFQDFLTSTEFEYHHNVFFDWQNHKEIKTAHLTEEEESDFPEWYEYHNLRTGNSNLLLLPDLRGNKEEFYIDLNRKESNKKLPIPTQAAQPLDDRPYFNYSQPSTITFLVSTFDDKETQKNHFYAQEHAISREGDVYLEEVMFELARIKEPFPLQAHYNFKEAILKTYNTYCNAKTAEHLPIAHEQYLFNRKMGFSTGEIDEWGIGLKENIKKAILNGRELNGEPRDLNF